MHRTYTHPIKNHYYALKGIPCDTMRQHVMSVKLDIAPICGQNYKTDVFGNKAVYGCIREPHIYFNSSISGIVETGLSCNEHIHDGNRFFADIFGIQSQFTQVGDELRRLFEKCSFMTVGKDKNTVTV